MTKLYVLGLNNGEEIIPVEESVHDNLSDAQSDAEIYSQDISKEYVILEVTKIYAHRLPPSAKKVWSEIKEEDLIQ